MGMEACEAWVALLWKRLRSPRLTLFILGFLVLYAGALVWLPWVSGNDSDPPLWAVMLGIDHPFSSLPFLAAWVLLFCNTFACTWDRTRKSWRLWLGEENALAVVGYSRFEGDCDRFLESQGFRKHKKVYCRYRFAFWGGWLFHVGILLLLIFVAVQRSCFDGGAFELTEGESLTLSDEGAVFSRERGVLAPSVPPGLVVGLISFDPYLHQKGYAPDRASLMRIQPPEGEMREALVDRSRGIEIGDVTIYQAIPSGVTLYLDIPGMGGRSLHLRSVTDRTARQDVRDPLGANLRFAVEADRRLSDPLGTGPLRIILERNGKKELLSPGIPFMFGSSMATIQSVGRWGGFTYSRSPGISLVFGSFSLILFGSLLMVFPAGIARVTNTHDGLCLMVHLIRGQEALQLDWDMLGIEDRKIDGSK